MLIGICSLTGQDIYINKNFISEEPFALARILNSIDGITCNILSYSVRKSTYDLLSNEEDNKSINNFNIVAYPEENPEDYDIILIYNGPLCYWGGEIPVQIIELFKWFHKIPETTKVYYLYNDASLYFKLLEVECTNEKRSKPLKPSKSFHDYPLTLPDDILVGFKSITVLTDFENIEFVQTKNSRYLKVDNIYDFKSANLILENYKDKMVNNTKEYDLIYGGSWRMGKRYKQILEYMINQKDIDVAIYGTIREKYFEKDFSEEYKKPTFLEKTTSNKIIDINSKGFATIVLYEKGYDTIITRRVYESIMAGCVVFFDSRTDKNRVFSPNNDFIYVSSGKELAEKIQKLKTDKKLYNKIIKNQLEFIENAAKYDVAKELEKIFLEKKTNQ